jgi:hypothetical protein
VRVSVSWVCALPSSSATLAAGAQDLDAFDLVGLDRVEREAARHALAVDQDLRVAVAQAAHVRRAAAARPVW